MATERLLMRHIREILRLKWTLRRSHRDTARSLGISAGAVASVVTRAKAMALTWDTVGGLLRTLLGDNARALVLGRDRATGTVPRHRDHRFHGVVTTDSPPRDQQSGHAEHRVLPSCLWGDPQGVRWPRNDCSCDTFERFCG